MADIVIENQESIENVELTNQLEKSQTIDMSTSQIHQESPTKAQPDQTDQKNGDPEKPDEEKNENKDEVENAEEVNETNAGEEHAEDEPKPRNSVETTKELCELHAIADKLLGLYKPDAPGPYSYYINNPNESYIYEKSVRSINGSPYKGEDRELIFEHRPTAVESEYKSSYAYASPEKFSSPHRYSEHEFEVVSEHRPRYDKEKLDQIINRILASPHTLNTVKNFGKGYTRNNEITLNRNRNIEAPVQSRYKEVKNAGLKQRGHFCGEVENDRDSLVEIQMADSAQNFYTKKQEYTNFYVGSLVDDEDDVPRNKRIGKRQQIISAKKQSKIESNSEFLRKGAYEQKNREQGKNIEAHKYFEANEAQIKDFDFSKQ